MSLEHYARTYAEGGYFSFLWCFFVSEADESITEEKIRTFTSKHYIFLMYHFLPAKLAKNDT